MRNLDNHPITQKEALDFLNELKSLFSFTNTKLIGDIRPIIIDSLIHQTKTKLKCKYLKETQDSCQLHNLYCSHPDCLE